MINNGDFQSTSSFSGEFTLVLDLDGVLTDGKIYQSEAGKLFKVFGPDDHDALNLAKKYMHVVVVSADEEGRKIARTRVVEKMGLDFFVVSALERGNWILNNFPNSFLAYMGDGFYDHLVFDCVDYGIAPANGASKAKKKANFVTESKGGERAVAEAISHILEKFYGVQV